MQTIKITDIYQKAKEGKPFACLTAYDASFAALMGAAEIDIVLVGDSLGMVLQGHSSTLPVTLKDMCYHTQAVAKGRKHALIMADIPFMGTATTQACVEQAGELMRAGAEVVKLEGGAWLADTIQALNQCGIPVCAHLGLTCQHLHRLGGFRVQANTPEKADELIEAAKTLEAAGAALILVECIPNAVTERLVQSIEIPVIGIGAGPAAHGQILVMHDALGIYLNKPARFVRNFMAGQPSILDAFKAYRAAVEAGDFPNQTESFTQG